MKLPRKSIYGLILLIVGFILTTAHENFRRSEDLNPARAFEIGGSYLIVYAIFAGSLVGLLIRFLKGRLIRLKSLK